MEDLLSKPEPIKIMKEDSKELELNLQRRAGTPSH